MQLDYDNILKIITRFYEKATFDIMIGYHFRGIEDFDSHIPRIASFWQLQLTGEVQDKRQLPFDLIQVHKPLKIKKAQIDRWVILFEQNLKENNVPEQIQILWMDKVNHLQQILKNRLTF